MAITGSVEDRLAVRDLLDAYADAVTQRDGEAWASLWAEDAVWSLPDLGEHGVSISGKSTIVSSWLTMMEQYHGPVSAPWAFSFLSTVGAMSVTGDTAAVRSYSTEVFAVADGSSRQLKGQYDDILVRSGEGWLFQSRQWRLMPLLDHQNFS